MDVGISAGNFRQASWLYNKLSAAKEAVTPYVGDVVSDGWSYVAPKLAGRIASEYVGSNIASAPAYFRRRPRFAQDLARGAAERITGRFFRRRTYAPRPRYTRPYYGTYRFAGRMRWRMFPKYFPATRRYKYRMRRRRFY